MAIIHEDTDGLRISLTVPTGKSLQQAGLLLKWGQMWGLLSKAVFQVAIGCGCCWGLLLGLQLKADVGPCSWELLLGARLRTDSRLTTI